MRVGCWLARLGRHVLHGDTAERTARYGAPTGTDTGLMYLTDTLTGASAGELLGQGRLSFRINSLVHGILRKQTAFAVAQ